MEEVVLDVVVLEVSAGDQTHSTAFTFFVTDAVFEMVHISYKT